MNLDRLAPFYQSLETLGFGNRLQHCRLAHLENIPPPARILLAGEGHGRFLPACETRFPEAEITVIDSSARMLGIARRKSGSPNTRFLHADLLDWKPAPASHDLIVTHFFLDCFTAAELPLVIESLSQAATPDARWLIADFQTAPSGIKRGFSHALLAVLYRFFRHTTGLRATVLVPPDNLLEARGFRRTRHQTRFANSLHSDVWERSTSPPR